jgi:hypothetical protein
MIIEYFFSFDDDTDLTYTVDLDRKFELKADRRNAPAWTQLTNHQCKNCPLDKKTYSHCPAALDLDQVVQDFQHRSAHTQVDVRVLTADREYMKRVSLEEGVRALMGLIMATSACPVFCELKPNARTHLPFATREESILRLVSVYLMKQYLEGREGKTPDWQLKGLVKEHSELQLVNQAFWQRLMAAFHSEANAKALLSFFTVSASISSSLDNQLDKMKGVFYID